MKLGDGSPPLPQKLQRLPHAVVATLLSTVPAQRPEVPRPLGAEQRQQFARRTVAGQASLHARLVRGPLIPGRRSDFGNKARCDDEHDDHGETETSEPWRRRSPHSFRKLGSRERRQDSPSYQHPTACPKLADCDGRWMIRLVMRVCGGSSGVPDRGAFGGLRRAMLIAVSSVRGEALGARGKKNARFVCLANVPKLRHPQAVT